MCTALVILLEPLRIFALETQPCDSFFSSIPWHRNYPTTVPVLERMMAISCRYFKDQLLGDISTPRHENIFHFPPFWPTCRAQPLQPMKCARLVAFLRVPHSILYASSKKYDVISIFLGVCVVAHQPLGGNIKMKVQMLAYWGFFFFM